MAHSKRRIGCLLRGHQVVDSSLRMHESRFHVELTSCLRCGAVLDGGGHRGWRGNK
jgi:hypothetical protein